MNYGNIEKNILEQSISDVMLWKYFNDLEKDAEAVGMSQQKREHCTLLRGIILEKLCYYKRATDLLKQIKSSSLYYQKAQVYLNQISQCSPRKALGLLFKNVHVPPHTQFSSSFGSNSSSNSNLNPSSSSSSNSSFSPSSSSSSSSISSFNPSPSFNPSSNSNSISSFNPAFSSNSNSSIVSNSSHFLIEDCLEKYIPDIKEVTAVTTELKQIEERLKEQLRKRVISSLTDPKASADVQRQKELSAKIQVFYPLKEKATDDAHILRQKREIQTEKHFFNPRRTSKQFPLTMATTLQNSRFSDNGGKPVDIPINQSAPTRQIITAELSTMQASLSVYGRGQNQVNGQSVMHGDPKAKTAYHKNAFRWHEDSREKRTYANKGKRTVVEECYSHQEKLKLDGISIAQYRQKTNPHRNYIGNAQVFDLGKPGGDGSYFDIIKFLDKIAGNNKYAANLGNEKKIAKYMLRFTKTGRTVNLQELKAIYSYATQDDLNILTTIFYHCFVKEITGRMLPADRLNDLPLATAQARALLLLQEGIIRMRDVFGKQGQYTSNDGKYAVFTASNAVTQEAIEKDLKPKINSINNLYMQHIVSKKLSSQGQLDFFKEHSIDTCVSAREELHQTLCEVFGGDGDTDGEGYDSDTGDTLYPSTFNFD
jgi:hypothetical protein